MRPDEDVDLALAEPFDGVSLFGLRAEARDVLDGYREVLEAF